MEIIISDLQEGIFYSKLICINEHNTVEIDSRTSDALALAVRFGCPIYTYEHILENAGIMMNESEGKTGQDIHITSENIRSGNEDLSGLTLDELKERLNKVLEMEDYIHAVAIRDEINRRKNK
jgi:bifunctional DNase/RNase